MDVIDESSLYQTVMNANAYQLAGGMFTAGERGELAAWILQHQNRQHRFAFYPTAFERQRGIRLLSGERLQTKLAADNAVEMETLRLLVLLEPLAPEARRLCETAEWRLAGMCYGQVCLTGECAHASISVLRYHTARGTERGAELISRGLDALYRDRSGTGQWRSLSFYYTLLWLVELGPSADERVHAELAYVQERCQRLLKRLRPEAPDRPFDWVRARILHKALSPAVEHAVAQDALFAVGDSEPYPLILGMPSAVKAQGARQGRCSNDLL